jgi:hypothetical protein
MLSKEQRKLVFDAIARKKTLKNLKESIILDEIARVLKESPKSAQELSKKSTKDFQRSALFKQLVKEVRRNLHVAYGSFQSTSNRYDRKALLEELKSNPADASIIHKILQTNYSTKERLSAYPEIYREIFKITSPPKNILDLGSGLNPLSFQFMNLKKADYLATEINEEDISFLNDYFSIAKPQGLNGKAIILNMKDPASEEILSQISAKADITFMFKFLESVELIKKKKYKTIESILRSTRSAWIVASFPTRTLSQRRMRFAERKWFEAMLWRLHLQFQKIEKENEIFYVIRNDSGN